MRSKLFCSVSFLGLLALLNASCKVKLPPPTTYANCTFTVDRFLGSCYTTASGNQHINYTINAKSSTVSGSDRVPVDDKTVNSPTGTQKQPVTISLSVPSDNKTPYEVEITIIGIECTLCASGRSNTAEGNGPCLSVLNSTQDAYIVAKPRWYYKQSFVDFSSARSVLFNNEPTMPNVPFSCGCTVPL